jgi:hypothetical protein
MQIAAPNLMIAAQATQQAARTKAPAAPIPKAVADDGFQSLNFAMTKQAAATAPMPGARPGAFARPGTQLDITV